MKKLFKRFRKPAGLLALVIGCVASAFGLDLAPAQIDLLVTAIATIIAAWKEREPQLHDTAN